MWLAIFAIVIIGLIVFFAINDYIEKETIRKNNLQSFSENVKNNREREMTLNSKYGRCSRQLCKDEYKNYTVRIFEDSQVIVINDDAYNFADIIGCQTATQPQQNAPYETITSTDNGDMALRAAIGGLALGSVGALAGAVTATKTTKVNDKKNLDRILSDALYDETYRTGRVTMFLKSIYTPQVFIQCYKSEEQEICSVINAIIAITQSRERG